MVAEILEEHKAELCATTNTQAPTNHRKTLIALALCQRLNFAVYIHPQPPAAQQPPPDLQDACDDLRKAVHKRFYFQPSLRSAPLNH